MAGRADFLSVKHPWFRPLWSRLAISVIVCGWALLELVSGNVFWAILFGSAGAWLVWQFFVVFDPKDYEPKEREDG